MKWPEKRKLVFLPRIMMMMMWLCPLASAAGLDPSRHLLPLVYFSSFSSSFLVCVKLLSTPLRKEEKAEPSGMMMISSPLTELLNNQPQSAAAAVNCSMAKSHERARHT